MKPLALLFALLFTFSAQAGMQLDKDGLAVIRLAKDEYRSIISNTPVISDKTLVGYLNNTARRLVPKGRTLPGGIRLDVTLLDKPMPEVYATADGHILLTSGALLALGNEAQLAALLAHEIAHLLEAHYPLIYQGFKAGQRKARGKALAAGMAGVVLGEAIDYQVQSKTADIYADAERGDISYREANKQLLALQAKSGTLEGFADIYQSLPPETKAGSGDPRLPLEMVADAEGLKLLVGAGYEPKEAAEAWRRVRAAADKARQSDTEAMAMAFLPPQMRQLLQGVSGPLGGIRAEALTRTISQLPPDRPALLEALAESREIKTLAARHKLQTGQTAFNSALSGYLLGDARKAYDQAQWARARMLYQQAWDSGLQNAEVAYRLGQSHLGGFAFAASETEKEQAERYLLKATQLEPRKPEPYKALGELYGEWEHYEEGIAMYRNYLKQAPKAKDRSRIERQIKKLERKARR